ncbi:MULTISPECIES: hypothetical protein [Stutzerimonas stutzeri group]|uniref:hypothetical protein n=1 Tax=Stutzerimonas stutzeri group TaxID=136846 RepID=UPI00190B7FC8|nr:hypothetical protein [Stutzerimonas frequens]MBK3757026.1 hypothetical protein [Stutzerimonas frequens]MBK3871636.1 hypothetical protein [Stutzerimonas frequens]MBK3909971.1 hypothetical protein [Stutzerimonas frequens]MBK3928460.1 hypothetical protein [Stutzerimonas frequens]
MCFAKTPKMKSSTPAAAPPAPEKSAADEQGVPENEGTNVVKKTPLRNKLRIDLDRNEEERKFGGYRL